MADLGSDAAGSSLSLMAKALEAILRLFEKIYETAMRSPERKKARLELKLAKTQAEREALVEKLSCKTGYVNYQDMKRSGMELKPINVYLTKEEMQRFSELCKREGVIFSGITDNVKIAHLPADEKKIEALEKKIEDAEKSSPKEIVDQLKDELKQLKKQADRRGKKSYCLIIRKCDAEGINNVVERMNDEKLIQKNEARISEIESRAKGRALTPQEQADIQQCRDQIALIKRKYCNELNDQMAENVYDKVMHGAAREPLTLDAALNRLTGRSIDKDVVTIVADANDPSKYIKCHGFQDTYNGKAYIKTDYEIYRDGQCVLKTHDGRFDGRPEGYWGTQKAAIQEAGGFSGTFFKFSSVAEYQKWAEAARTQNAQELSSMEQKGAKNYDDIIAELESQLDANGAKLQDGVVVDKATDAPLVLSDDLTPEQKSLVVESTVIGKQINNYQELTRLEAELHIAEAAVMVSEEGSPEYKTAEAKLAQVKNDLDAARTAEQTLLTERKEVNAVQAEQEVRSNPELSKSQEIEYLPDDKSKVEVLVSNIAAKEADIAAMQTKLENLPGGLFDAEYGALETDLTRANSELASMCSELEMAKAQAELHALSEQHPDIGRSERVEDQEDHSLDKGEATDMADYRGLIDAERTSDAAEKAANMQDHSTQDLGAKAATATTKAVSSHDDR